MAQIEETSGDLVEAFNKDEPDETHDDGVPPEEAFYGSQGGHGGAD